MTEKRPIKIIRIIARLNVGGPAVHCWTLSSQLAAHGFETTLVTGVIDDTEASFDKLYGARPKGFKLLRLRSFQRLLSVFGDVATLFELIAIMRRERPQIVHTHTAKAGALGRIAAIVTGVPVVVHTFHGHVLSGYFSKTMSALICVFERVLAWKTTAIVTLSPKLREELSQHFHVAPLDRFRVIPLGRDLSEFMGAARYRGALRSELGIGAPGTRLIGVIGRLVPIKNHGLFLEALSQLKTTEPWLALIVGEGPCHEELAAQVQSLGLGQRVRFLGWRSDLARILADLDAFVISSINEGTPLSMIESFAAGCPAIATDVGGVSDMFHVGTARDPGLEGMQLKAEGILVEAGNAPALARAIDFMFKNSEFRADCAKAACLTAKDYSQEKLVESAAALYHELLDKEAA